MRLGPSGIGEPADAVDVQEAFSGTLAALGELEREVAELRARLEIVEELGTADRGVLAFQPIQGREQDLRLSVVHFPDVTPSVTMSQLLQDPDPMVTIENLEPVGFGGMRPDDEVRIAPGALQMRRQLVQ